MHAVLESPHPDLIGASFTQSAEVSSHAPEASDAATSLKHPRAAGGSVIIPFNGDGLPPHPQEAFLQMLCQCR